MTDKHTVEQVDREAAARVRPHSHNSALILNGERDGTDIVRAAMFARIEATRQADADLAEALEALRTLRKSAALLQQNAEGCAMEHYGAQLEHGLPGWLADTEKDIASAASLLAKHRRPA